MGMPRTILRKTCQDCSAEFETVWARKVCCDGCGIARRDASAKRGIAATKAGKSPALQEIEMTTAQRKSSIMRAFDAPEFEWIVTFKVKHSLDASKNRRWSNNGKGAVFLSESVRRYQDYLIHATKRAMQGTAVCQNKVWISLFVQKPNHRSDAINVVDTVCDAIKAAIDLDDRWFCIGRLDWEIKRNDPEIFITIGQASREDMIVCSHCGDIKALDEFGLKKGGPLGRQRVCKECTAVMGKHRKRARASITA